MNKEKILGVAGEFSAQGKSRLETQEMASAAQGKTDVVNLYAAYEKAVSDRYDAEKVLMGALSVMAGSDSNVIPPSNDQEKAILAIRDIALAAISMARDICLKEKPGV